MIKSLFLKDIFLFDKQEIEFDENLNIITGETGSGKSNILKSLLLLLGAKADTKIIKKNKDKAILEGLFSINSKISTILKKEDIDIDQDELLIRREIFKNGKNRIFINDNLINVAILKKLSPYLLEIVSQNSNQDLVSKSYQLKLLDLFSNLKNEVASFSQDFTNLKTLEKKLEELKSQKQKSEKKKIFIQEEIDEIEKANLQENEEEEITKEHSLLVNSHDILEKINHIYSSLIDSNNPIIPTLKTYENDFLKLSNIDNNFSESLNLLKNANIELEEVSHFLMQYKSKIEPNPERLQQIEERLSEIYTIKKKYGNTYKDIHDHMTIKKTELDDIENIDEKIEKLSHEIKNLSQKVKDQSLYISKTRHLKSKSFEDTVVQLLKELNMSSAKFKIEIQQTETTSTGIDSIEFLFSANIGQKLHPLKSIASGGELSRLMLAVKTTLSNKDRLCIIFDEIDSNVGGESAAIIGNKLKELAKVRQIILVTHFVQVAKKADTHFLISKLENNNLTTSYVKKLNKEEKQAEFNRMIGFFK